MADASHEWRLAYGAGNHYTIYGPGNLQICLRRFHPENVYWDNDGEALEPGHTAKHWRYYIEETLQLSLFSLYRPLAANYHQFSLGLRELVIWGDIPDVFAERLHQFMAGDIYGV
jgi:hypothetical protein